MLDDGQAEPGAAQVPAARPVHPVEPLEQARQMVRGNPAAPVPDANDDCAGFFRGPHLDAIFRLAVFDRVVHQVHHRLLEQRRIDPRPQPGLALEVDAGVFFAGLDSATLDGRFQ